MSDGEEDRGVTISDESDGAPPTPRWVKLVGLLVLGLLVLVAVLHLVGGGLGPGTHMQPGP